MPDATIETGRHAATGPVRRASLGTAAPQSGFTLIELLLVILVLGLVTRLVVPAFSQDLPRTAVQAEAEKLAIELNYLRSETRLRARSYGLELDMEQQRFRVLLPPEFKVVDEEANDYRDRDEIRSLDWRKLPESVRFIAIDVGTGEQRDIKRNEIRFDPAGRTHTKVIVLGHAYYPEIQFSITVPSIAGQVLVEEGHKELPKANDYDF